MLLLLFAKFTERLDFRKAFVLGGAIGVFLALILTPQFILHMREWPFLYVWLAPGDVLIFFIRSNAVVEVLSLLVNMLIYGLLAMGLYGVYKMVQLMIFWLKHNRRGVHSSFRG